MTILSLFLSAAVALAAAGEKSGPWTSVLDSPEGHFSLTYDPGLNHFDVIKLDQRSTVPSQVRLKVHRKVGEPLDLKLKTVEAPGEKLHYSGDFLNGDQSFTGVELQLSFDKKTWKSVGRFLGVSAH